ncbi:hypothetical protein K1719_024461 [Acacia pycnantha]|nr:hypothetical protein K1719_024461 [Acacia pycnantha]
MELGGKSSGTRRPQDVHLNLSTSINGQKGRALVGWLETDKSLNRGIVISLIKKGWGIDKGMEIHEMPDKNAYLFRFTKQEDFHRNYCYGCGRIGHEVRICKFQTNYTDDVVADNRVGIGLGTPHVKTIEEALVAHDLTWEESSFLYKKHASATGQYLGQRLAGEIPQQGNSMDRGKEPASHLLHCEIDGNEKGMFSSTVTDTNQGGFQLYSIPTITATTMGPSIGEFSPNINNHFQGYKIPNVFSGEDQAKNAQTHPLPYLPDSHKITGEEIVPAKITIPISQEHPIHCSPKPVPANPLPYYRVDFLTANFEDPRALVPFVELSPLSAVTTGVQSISLKR